MGFEKITKVSLLFLVTDVVHTSLRMKFEFLRSKGKQYGFYLFSLSALGTLLPS